MLTRLIAGFAAALLTLGVLGAPASAEDGTGAAKGEMIDLGVAMAEPNVRFTTSGSDGQGHPLFFAVSDGHPAAFYAVDATSGEVVFEWVNHDPSDEYLGGDMYGYDGGALFIMRRGSQSTVYRYDHASATVTQVVRGCWDGCTVPSGVFRGVTATEDGVIHLATYPDSKVFSFDPATGAVTDHGPTAETGDYAWGLDRIGHELFIGTGTGAAELWRLDLETDTSTRIPLPDGATPTVIGEVQATGSHIAVPFNNGSVPMGIYDTVTETWTCLPDLPGVPGPTDAFSEPTADGTIYTRVGSDLYEIDPVNCTTRSLGFTGSTVELRSTMLATTDTPDGPSYSVGAFYRSGDIAMVDPATGSSRVVDTAVTGAPVTAHALGVGPDGKVYVCAYLSPGTMARVTPQNEIEQIDGPEQSSIVRTIGDRVVVGSYPNGVVHAGDPSQPWSWGTNPTQLFSLGAEYQDRVFDMVDADGLGVLGTVSKYGHLGGALVVFDPTGAEDHQTYQPATDQSIVALAYRNGIVWGGTSIHNALSTEPTTTEAQIFGFDMATRRTVHLSVPVPGAETLSDLEFDARPTTLWGITYDNTLFRFDTRARKVIRTVDIPLPALGPNWGRVPEIEFSQRDRLLYGVAGESFFSYDPVTGVYTLLSNDHAYKTLTITDEGRIYLIDNTNIFEWRPAR